VELGGEQLRPQFGALGKGANGEPLGGKTMLRFSCHCEGRSDEAISYRLNTAG
jgi:hypothetical protein